MPREVRLPTGVRVTLRSDINAVNNQAEVYMLARIPLDRVENSQQLRSYVEQLSTGRPNEISNEPVWLTGMNSIIGGLFEDLLRDSFAYSSSQQERTQIREPAEPDIPSPPPGFLRRLLRLENLSEGNHEGRTEQEPPVSVDPAAQTATEVARNFREHVDQATQHFVSSMGPPSTPVRMIDVQGESPTPTVFGEVTFPRQALYFERITGVDVRDGTLSFRQGNDMTGQVIARLTSRGRTRRFDIRPSLSGPNAYEVYSIDTELNALSSANSQSDQENVSRETIPQPTNATKKIGIFSAKRKLGI